MDLLEPDKKDTRFVRLSDISFLAGFVLPVWKLGSLSVFLIIARSLLAVLLPLSSKLVVDFLILKKSTAEVDLFFASTSFPELGQLLRWLIGSPNHLMLAILCCGLALGLLGMAQSIINLRFQQEVTFNIQTALFDRILRYPVSILKAKQAGYLVSRVSGDVARLQHLFSYTFPQIALLTTYLLFGSVILFKLDPDFAAILLITFLAMASAAFLIAIRVRQVSHREMQSQADVIGDMHEVIAGAELVKAYGAEEREVEKVTAGIKDVFSASMRNMTLSSFAGFTNSAFKTGAVLLIVWLGIRRVDAGTLSIGDLTALVAYAYFLSGRVVAFCGALIAFQSSLASLERVARMFEINPETNGSAKGSKAIAPADLLGGIEFRDASFAYSGHNYVLDSVSLTVNPGDVVALTGPSGAGKTTLVSLILKFFQPQKGRILLDGRDIMDLDTRWLRDQIGIVSQDVFLFSDSIENNIKYGKISASFSEVVAAARQAGIDAEIRHLREGYRTKVGERGYRLSAGQRQRISIARAFLRNSRILILDEPTSALDKENQILLEKSISRLTKNRTVFVISHNDRFCGFASRVIAISEGRVKELRANELPVVSTDSN